jgi:hypothetical protein
MLPPSFMDFVLSRHHADGVLISGCAGQDCFERLGDQWTEQRIANQRDPHLRDRVSRDRVAVCWQNPTRPGGLRESLKQFRSHLREGDTAPRRAGSSAWRSLPRGLPLPLKWAGQGVAYAALVACIGFLATRPAYSNLPEGQALLKLSFTHAGEPLKPCRHFTHEELGKMKFRDRSATSCERGRWPVYVELDLDGKALYRGEHQPAGLWDDGPSSVYRRFEIPAGRHRLDIRLRDDGSSSGFDYHDSREVTIAPGENFVVDFRGTGGGFLFGRAGRPVDAAAKP